MNGISHERFNDITKNFNKARFMVLGDLMVDKYIWGVGIRLSSEAPVPVIRVDREEYRLGGAANIAFHLCNLQASTYLTGIVGYDDAAHHLRNQIVQTGIPAGGIFPSSARPTTQKVRIMSLEHSQILSRFDYEADTPLTDEEQASLRHYISTYSDEINSIVIADHGKGVFQSESFIRFIKELSQRRRLLTIAQCRTSELEKFSWVDHLIVNYKKAQHFLHLKKRQDYSGIELVGQSIRDYLGLSNLTLYDSASQTIALFRENQDVFKQNDIPIQLVDQTGIGDVATAALAVSLGSGASLEEAIILAQRGSISAGQQIGTGRITVQSLV